MDMTDRRAALPSHSLPKDVLFPISMILILAGTFPRRLNVKNTLIIYTPAIPPENKIITYFRNNGYSSL